jgi:hypothetical protein
MSCTKSVNQSNKPVDFRDPGQTYSNKLSNPRPHLVIGQLSPSPLMHNRPLVHTATHQVHQDRNQHDNAEDASGAQRLLLYMHASTGMRRAAFEKVYAVVYGGDEGYGCLGERVGFAEQRDDGRFTPFRVFAGGEVDGSALG